MEGFSEVTGAVQLCLATSKMLEKNWMVEETANLEGQDQVNNNNTSFEDAAIGDHQNDIGRRYSGWRR
jgi:hypothetical protein